MIDLSAVGGGIVNVLIIILLIIVLVLFHEFGHFIVAKICGMMVREFSIGMGPVLFSFKKGDTQYSIRAFPIGGFVDILGEDCADEENDNCETKAKNNPKSFVNKPVWQRILVIVAGVTMNLLLSVGLFYVLLMNNKFELFFANDGYEYTPVFGNLKQEFFSDLYYESVDVDGLAKTAGMPENGYIKSVNDARIENYSGLQDSLSKNKNSVVNINICGESEVAINWTNQMVNEGNLPSESLDDFKNEITCAEYEVPVSNEGTIGITLNSNNSFNTLQYAPGGQRIFSGFLHVVNTVDYSAFVLPKYIGSYLEKKDYQSIAVQTVSSPIAIYFVVDKLKDGGLDPLLQMALVMSLSLAFVNILPIPALDGGRIILLFIEWIFRKPLNRKIENLIVRISFYGLLIFMALIVLKDILFIKVLQNLFK